MCKRLLSPVISIIIVTVDSQTATDTAIVTVEVLFYVSMYLLTFIMRRHPYYVVGALEIFSMI